MTRSKSETTLSITVEFEDVDSYRIAHHARLIAYLERARLRFLASVGVDTGCRDYAVVLYDLSVRFLKPARLMDVLEVCAEPVAIDEVRLSLRYRIRRGNDLILKATSDLAFADQQTGEVMPVPEAIAAKVRGMVGG